MPFRALVETSAFTAAQRRVWSRTTRKLVAVFIVLALVDLNSTRVHGLMRGLVASWQEAETLHRMGSLAAALDAEFASSSRYPDAEAFHDFARAWIDGLDHDPAADYWGGPITLRVEGVGYELVSCGRDTVCGTADDLRRRGGLTPATESTPP